MRWVCCWLIGGMMVSPVSCGSSNESGSGKSPAKSAVLAEQSKSDGTSPTSKTPTGYVDPLVPAIDLGEGYVASSGHSGGSIEFLSVDEFDFSSDQRAAFHPHGEQVCASGCAASRHPTRELTEPEFGKLLKQFAGEPISEESPSLEKLLYFGRQTTHWIARRGTGPLDAERAAFLRRELTRTHALISFRIVDEHGVVRTQLPPTRVPLDRRHVFKMDVKELPPLITSGTVKRVGLHHLWTRL